MRQSQKAEALRFLASAEIDTLALQDDGSVVLASLNGASVRIKILGFEGHHEPEKPDPPLSLFFTRPEWSEDILRERSLPPEWSRDWVIRELGLRKNDVRLLAEESGRPADAIRRMVGEHGIQNAQAEYAEQLWRSGEFATKRALAKHLGMSETALAARIATPSRNEHNERLEVIVERIMREYPELSTKMADQLILVQAKKDGDPRNDRKILNAIQLLRRR